LQHHEELRLTCQLQVAEQAGKSAVYGVIPRALAPREVSGELIGEIQIVEDMHTRKV
jgi:hypothetical protein